MIEFGADPFVFFDETICKKNLLIGIDKRQLSTYKVSLPAHF
jgi:hypothetical protein